MHNPSTGRTLSGDDRFSVLVATSEPDKSNTMRFIPDDDSTIFSKDDKTDAAGASTVGGEFIVPLQLHQSDDHPHDV